MKTLKIFASWRSYIGNSLEKKRKSDSMILDRAKHPSKVLLNNFSYSLAILQPTQCLPESPR